MIVQELTAEEKKRYRRLEFIPGILVWTTFAAVIILSFIRPYWAIVFIIAFDLYWMLRIFYLLVYLLTSYKRLKENIKIDWMNRLRDLPDWERIHHLIVLPTYKEDFEIIDGTFEALIKSRYPLKKMIVVLAGEERDEKNFKNIVGRISAKYGDFFRKLLITIHPKDIPGEVAAKGANIHWAGHQAQKFIDQAEIPYRDIIVSCFDIDTIVHRQYFAALAFQYLTHPNPLRASFQPIALYNNNIWDSPALMRVVANSTSFWLLTELVRPERLFTFSSHSMSFQALADVGFWDNTIVTEDSRIFLQCFLRYDGDYKVTPLYMPVSMDTVLGKTLRRSLVNQYKQQRRWAWGVEHLPFMIWNFRKNPKISKSLKIRYLWILAEGMYSWATAPILIFILGWLPLAVSNAFYGNISGSVLAQNAPKVLEALMRIGMLGLFASAIISTVLLPPKPYSKRFIKYAEMILQWILFPVCMIVFGSIPAIESQTRLMLGKYLGFWVTEKARKN